MKFKKEIYFVGGIIFVFALLVLIEAKVPNFARYFPIWENKLLITVLNINLLLILLLLFLITRIILKAYIEEKRGIWGSGLKKKLTSTLLFISVIPSFTLFILATGFFYATMDRWFSQHIEDTMENALELSRLHYEEMFQRYNRIGSEMVGEIEQKNMVEDVDRLDGYLKRYKRTHVLEYIAVYSAVTGEMIASKGTDGADRLIIPKIKTFMRQQVVKEIIPSQKGEMLVVGLHINDREGTTSAILFLADTIEIKGAERIKQIAFTSKEFKESRVFKKVLKYSFIVPLLLITMLTIFGSLWAGIKMATEITVPIEKIKDGAAIIAKGKFDISLEDKGKDEIGTLVAAFNSMARELNITKDEIEEKSRSLEVILNNVATGIISTDKKGNVLLTNRAARQILGIDREDLKGTPLREIFGNDFKALTRSFLREVKSSESITKDLRLNLKNSITYLRASLTALKDERRKVDGFIIAFDDITHIVRSEKLATWREVARKLTHEIKNPLTPIVLSAERIRRKVLSRFSGEDREILDETTSVIIRSVDDIKGIVNELTKLTHMSQVKMLADVNAIVEETVNLYRNLYRNITFSFQQEEVPPFRIDREGFKRALINLVTNSVKAIGIADGIITIRSRYEKLKGLCIIEFADTGPGVSDGDKEKIFDPYFTKDKDGTGLGLAIVYSIVLEHHGKVRIEDNFPQGARFIIEIPVIET